MISQRATRDETYNLLTDGFVSRRAELLQRLHDGVQRVVAAQLAAGHPVFSSGIGEESGRLFVHTSDGRRCAYVVSADGERKIIDDGA